MRVVTRGIALGVAILAYTFLAAIYLVRSQTLSAFLFSHAVASWALALVAGLLASWIWERFARSDSATSVFVPHGIDAAVRWALALGLLDYALAKFNMNQFPPPFPWTQDMTLANLSPFRLAWAFFGTSQGNVRFIGMGELVAAGLLLSRHTAFVGSLVALALLINIAAIDFSFGARGVLPLVCALGACALITLALRYPKVRRLFDAELPPRPERRAVAGLAFAGYAAGILGALWIARTEYQFARRRGEASPLGGRWEIDSCQPANALLFCAPGLDTSRTRLYLNLWFGNGRMRIGGFSEPFSVALGNRAYSDFLTYAHDERSDSVSLAIFPVAPSTGDTVRLHGKAAPTDSLMVLSVGSGGATVRLRRRQD